MSSADTPTVPLPVVVVPQPVSHHDPIFFLDTDGTVRPEHLAPGVLAALNASSFELIWVTRALHDARQWLAPSLALPDGTPVLAGFAPGRSKLGPLRTRASGRRFVWASTETTTLLVTADQLTVPLDPTEGLTLALAEAAVGWAAARSWTPHPRLAETTTTALHEEAAHG